MKEDTDTSFEMKIKPNSTKNTVNTDYTQQMTQELIRIINQTGLPK